MYINRQPLGRGNLTFGKKRPRRPVFLLIIYLIVLAAALIVFWRVDDIRPAVYAALGPTPTATPSVEFLTGQGDLAYGEGEIADAVVFYQQATEIIPDDYQLWAHYSLLLTLNSEYEAGLAAADQAILLNPEAPEGHAARSRALNWMGDYDQAAISALRSIDMDPNYALAHAFLSESYTDLGRLRQASDEAKRAIELDPYSAEARRNYAYVLEFYGDYNGAIQQYQQALQLEPNRLDLRYGLARNYRGAGEIEKAVNTFLQIAIRIPEDPLPYVELGKTFFEVRDDAAAQDYLQQAMELVCTDCPRNNYEVVLDTMEKGGELDPATLPETLYTPAWRRLGMVYFTRRNYEASLEVFEELIAWGELNEEEIPLESYYVTASAYYYLDKCDVAIPRAQFALRLYERNLLEDPNALKNILSIFVLCRDYAFVPYVYVGEGYENGFPLGYDEPDVLIERGGSSSESDDEDDS